MTITEQYENLYSKEKTAMKSVNTLSDVIYTAIALSSLPTLVVPLKLLNEVKG